MTKWTDKTEQTSSVVVMLDGKNSAHSSWHALQKAGLDAHIFVAEANGSHSSNPVFKGNDHSEQFRAGELEAIARLHRISGVAAVFVEPSMFTHDRELSSVIDSVHAIDPSIRVIGVGANFALDEVEKLGPKFDGRIRSVNAAYVADDLKEAGIELKFKGTER